MKSKFLTPIIITISILLAIIAIIFSFKDVIYISKFNKVAEEILSDDFEIERKWLIDKSKIPFNLTDIEPLEIEQTYICFSPEIRVRKLNKGAEYTFTVKTNMTNDGLIRNELEENITEDDYNSLIVKKEGSSIYKNRYQILQDDLIYAIDIFKENLDGLAYLEIEFKNKEQADNFITPKWVIKEVTSDIRYKNGHLARYGIPK